MSDRVDILLVDDDQNDVDVALRAVRREDLNVEVSVARSGDEALEMLGIDAHAQSDPDVEPCVVFLDLKMPGTDGWDVLRQIRANEATRTLPVVVLSWSGQRKDVERCYELGANSYLVKRFEPASPGAYFALAVRFWADLNEVPAN